MFGHHVWCNYASPKNDPTTCKQCKMLNTKYPEKEGMMKEYFPDAVVVSKCQKLMDDALIVYRLGSISDKQR